VKPAWSSTSPVVGVTFGSAAILSGLRAMAVTLVAAARQFPVISGISNPARPEAPATAIFVTSS
jgi:hypothetical protein